MRHPREFETPRPNLAFSGGKRCATKFVGGIPLRHLSQERRNGRRDALIGFAKPVNSTIAASCPCLT
ncbi:hypothetical protein KM043_006727 [Ampulex compressa]|nr:hypothetical protein KM043_006727 [Ampulex compressa]